MLPVIPGPPYEETIMHDSETKIAEPPLAKELRTPTDLAVDAVEEITAALRHLLADVFAPDMKTKSFHWHMSGRHFRDYHLLLDEHSEQDLRDDGRHRRTGSQARWDHPPLDSATSPVTKA